MHERGGYRGEALGRLLLGARQGVLVHVGVVGVGFADDQAQVFTRQGAGAFVHGPAGAVLFGQGDDSAGGGAGPGFVEVTRLVHHVDADFRGAFARLDFDGERLDGGGKGRLLAIDPIGGDELALVTAHEGVVGLRGGVVAVFAAATGGEQG